MKEHEECKTCHIAHLCKNRTVTCDVCGREFPDCTPGYVNEDASAWVCESCEKKEV